MNECVQRVEWESCNGRVQACEGNTLSESKPLELSRRKRGEREREREKEREAIGFGIAELRFYIATTKARQGNARSARKLPPQSRSSVSNHKVDAIVGWSDCW